jgi:heme oxygenase-like protein
MTAAAQATPIPCTVIDQRRLFDLYQGVPDLDGYAEILRSEQNWIGALAERYRENAPRFESPGDLLKGMSEFLSRESSVVSDNHLFLAEHATRKQFKHVAAEFAIDGLTESLSLLPVIARLPYRSGMAVFRIILDELGCGNEAMAHSQLYRELLEELDMPTNLAAYFGVVSQQSFAYVNMFHWLARRAPTVEYFLGGYAYFEASVLYGFRSFARATRRLGLKSGRYYSEHLYIANYHSKQMRVAIRETAAARTPDLAAIWAGIELTSAIVADATETAIETARKAG